MTWKKSESVRGFEIVILSTLGGMLCGGFMPGIALVISGFDWGDIEWLPFVSVGGVIGLLASPIIVGCLLWRPLGKSFALMLGAALAVQVTSFIFPPIAALLSIMAFIAMAPVARNVLPDIRIPPDPSVCADCGYSLKGLALTPASTSHPPHRRCPECGHNNPARKT